MTDEPIHYSDYASQPDVRIYCDGSWTTPAWAPADDKTEMPAVYRADTMALYTFERPRVTCERCLAKLAIWSANQ